MNSQITLYERDQEVAFENNEKLAKLYEKGVIDLDGEYKEE